MDQIQQLEELLTDLKVDSEKFYVGGNKAAGTRARKTAMKIKNLAQTIRVDIQETKNGQA